MTGTVLPRPCGSLPPYRDELVVLDGAYGGMAELLRQMGRQPARSEQSVRDAIAAAGLPVSGLSKASGQTRWRGGGPATGPAVAGTCGASLRTGS
ncbi:hypothetical protein SAMN02927895_05588 [Belnapia rosea]|nr:hypothetical protein SAMN02927895_05588 [Belnapia rosea]